MRRDADVVADRQPYDIERIATTFGFEFFSVRTREEITHFVNGEGPLVAGPATGP